MLHWHFFVAFLLMPSFIYGQSSDVERMASLGDSITRAFNSGSIFLDHPSVSWSTGTTDSHRSRLQDLVGYKIEAKNFAKTGAKVNDLSRQVSQAIAMKADYVTLLIGANDVCSWPVHYQESLESFETEIRDQMERLIAHLPDVRILLSSIPDIYQVWQIGSQNKCQAIWTMTGFCKAMLGKNRSESDRLLVREKWLHANEVLRDVSATYNSHIKFAESVMNYQFKAQDISRTDCFHPSLKGQKRLAEETWKESWFENQINILQLRSDFND